MLTACLFIFYCLFIGTRDLDKLMMKFNLGLGENLICFIQMFNV